MSSNEDILKQTLVQLIPRSIWDELNNLSLHPDSTHTLELVLPSGSADSFASAFAVLLAKPPVDEAALNALREPSENIAVRGFKSRDLSEGQKRAVTFIDKLGRATGLNISYQKNGSLRLQLTPKQMDSLCSFWSEADRRHAKRKIAALKGNAVFDSNEQFQIDIVFDRLLNQALGDMPLDRPEIDPVPVMLNTAVKILRGRDLLPPLPPPPVPKTAEEFMQQFQKQLSIDEDALSRLVSADFKLACVGAKIAFEAAIDSAESGAEKAKAKQNLKDAFQMALTEETASMLGMRR